MDTWLLRMFQMEVERQTAFALRSHAELEAALAAGKQDELWHAVQGLLVAAANVSKLLWTSGSDRRQDLRMALGVPDDSILASREMRNHFEHFDERLERWAQSSESKNFVDSCVARPGAFNVGPQPGDYLRHFDTTDHSVTFCGDKYRLRPIVEALRDLNSKARTESKGPSWQ